MHSLSALMCTASHPSCYLCKMNEHNVWTYCPKTEWEQLSCYVGNTALICIVMSSSNWLQIACDRSFFIPRPPIGTLLILEDIFSQVTMYLQAGPVFEGENTFTIYIPLDILEAVYLDGLVLAFGRALFLCAVSGSWLKDPSINPCNCLLFFA